ncbi:MAG: methyltransferase domain-containing protein [Terrimonas sp.]|nr:methyltransferase domain-containing protein [Terrimonas sp.]
MDKNYWEKLAPVHQDEMFNVLKNDRKKIILKQIEQLGSKRKTVADMGCALGRWLPALSKNFRKVYAIDIAEKFITLAKENNSDLHNIEYIRADAGNIQPVPCDVVLCVNAVMTPVLAKRDAFFRTISDSLPRNGHLILVVPSLESALFSEAMLERWHFKDGTSKPIFTGDNAVDKFENLKSGIYDLDGVPTKHYLKEEIKALLPQYQLQVKEVEKIEYTWDTEFESPPSWLQSPRPWDWMFVAKKKTAKAQ